MSLSRVIPDSNKASEDIEANRSVTIGPACVVGWVVLEVNQAEDARIAQPEADERAVQALLLVGDEAPAYSRQLIMGGVKPPPLGVGI